VTVIGCHVNSLTNLVKKMMFGGRIDPDIDRNDQRLWRLHSRRMSFKKINHRSEAGFFMETRFNPVTEGLLHLPAQSEVIIAWESLLLWVSPHILAIQKAERCWCELRPHFAREKKQAQKISSIHVNEKLVTFFELSFWSL
jgi:hypothetical protein